MSDGKHPEDEDIEEEVADVPEAEAETEVEVEAEAEDPVEAARREAEDYKDRWIRLAAEFENYKKRTARERDALIQTANESLMRELLTIKDSVDRALDHADGDTENEAYREGVRMIMEEFPRKLAARGLEEIDAIGKPFDPNDHEALMQIPSEKHEAGLVTDVVERGYRLGDRVLRHARVVVSTGPPEASADAEEEEAKNGK